jgi:hypothetical protein
VNPRVDIACNDPDNGLFEGRAWMIQVGSLELGANDFRGPKMRELPDSIVIAGKHWPITGSQEWVGNWCWNRYEMEIDTLVDFLIWAHRRDFWSIDQGEERIYNLWQRRDNALAESRDFLARYFAKPST